MSREIFVALDERDVLAKCETAKVGVSAIEPLPAGGVRLVCMSSDGAAVMNRKFKAHLIKDQVVRARHRPIH
jgi:hypothetical protein